MEKFQLSIQNLNNLWSFIEVYAVLVPNLCGEKSVRRKSVWRKNDKYEVCECSFVIVEVMVLSLIVLIVLENVCGGAGGSDDQELR